MRLIRASRKPPQGLADFLTELGDGENGFTGTPFSRGEMTLGDYLQSLCDGRDPAKVRPGLVPQTVFWVLDRADRVVGMVKVRHRLNRRLLIHGGHIGYYIRPSERGKGYGKEALRLALKKLRALGVKKALVTVSPDNIPSARVVLANGGRLRSIVSDPETRRMVARYWIRLA